MKASSGGLQLRLGKAVLMVDGSPVESLPVPVPAGGTLSLRIEEQTLSWNVGQAITLPARACHDIAMSLIQFCLQVRQEMGRAINQLLGGVP